MEGFYFYGMLIVYVAINVGITLVTITGKEKHVKVAFSILPVPAYFGVIMFETIVTQTQTLNDSYKDSLWMTLGWMMVAFFIVNMIVLLIDWMAKQYKKKKNVVPKTNEPGKVNQQ